MCGVVALWSPGGGADTARMLVRDLARAIKHRGPDHQGEWMDPDTGLALAHRRLSIVDLSPEGHQPMVSQTGRYILSYNGEIYNFEELRAELRAAGVTFRGRSDTEVFLAAVETWGLNSACQKINGMFAIVLYDRQARHLHLIRDRLGKKPIFVGWVGRDLLVASELKVFLAHPDFVRDLSPVALDYYWRMGFIPSPHTMFRGVRSLHPGTRMMFDLGAPSAPGLWPSMEPYWVLARVMEDRAYQPSPTPRDLERLIHSAVQDRMMADVPMGAFLSGGIDSSLVTAVMQHQSKNPIKTFSIGFDDPQLNEAPMAAQIAAHLGTDHHEHIVTASEAQSVLPLLPTLMDQPLADASIIPTYLLARFAREHVTVALTGDGGDELFGGYYRHRAMPTLAMIQRMIPPMGRDMAGSILRHVSGMIPARRSHILKLASALSTDDAWMLYECLAGGGEVNAVTARTLNPRDVMLYQTTSWPVPTDPKSWAQMADALHYLPHDVLVKVDRATMAVGLEARSPLLDTRLWRDVWGLPIHERQGKKFLRDMLARYVPPPLWSRRKQGFTVPLGAWLRGPLRPWAEDLLTDPCLGDRLGLSIRDVEQIWQGHIKDTHPAPETLWRMCLMVAWMRHYKV